MTIQQYDPQDPRNQDQSKPPAPVVDAERFADAMFSRWAQSGQMQAPPTRQERSEIVNAIAALQNEGYPEDYIRGVTMIGQAALMEATKNLESKQRTSQTEFAQKQIWNEAKREVNASLRSIYRDHPELKEDDASIRDKFAKWANENPHIGNEMYRTGEVPADLIAEKLEEIADGYLSRLGKKRDKADKEQPSLRLVSDNSGRKIAAADTKDGPSNAPVDPDSLSRDQREAYGAALLNNKKFLKMNDADARRDAFEYAKQLPENYQTYERKRRLGHE